MRDRLPAKAPFLSTVPCLRSGTTPVSYTHLDVYKRQIWGWATRLSFAVGEAWPEMFPHVKRHLDEISARPAAQRAVALKDQFAFKTDFDAEARKFLFPQNAHLAS